MSTNSLLESTLNQILAAIKPSREDTSLRYQVIYEFQAVVQTVEGLRDATVEPFGSFVSNLYSKWADLDISIELPNGLFISPVTRKRKLSLLRALFRALRGKGEWCGVEFISNARVPIIKFETLYRNISCDISMDNMIGKMKSRFLCWIAKVDERFRDMVLLVKEWAKAHGINDSRSGTFNSYSLSLLVVFHFQTCVPAIFPPLKEIYPGNIVDDLTDLICCGISADVENRITETCAANIEMFKSNRSRTVNRSSLSELFISFLVKFSNIRSMALEHGICLHNGQWENINTNVRWWDKTYVLLIEDPFEKPENVARAVTRTQLERISSVINATYHNLVSPYASHSSLVDSLVGPQVAQIIPRITPQFSGGSFRTNPQVHRAPYSPTQVRHWS